MPVVDDRLGKLHGGSEVVVHRGTGFLAVRPALLPNADHRLRLEQIRHGVRSAIGLAGFEGVVDQEPVTELRSSRCAVQIGVIHPSATHVLWADPHASRGREIGASTRRSACLTVTQVVSSATDLRGGCHMAGANKGVGACQQKSAHLL